MQNIFFRPHGLGDNQATTQNNTKQDDVEAPAKCHAEDQVGPAPKQQRKHSEPECSSNDHNNRNMDIGKYKNSSLTGAQRHDLLTNVWKPSRNFCFPETEMYGKMRKFNYTWLEQFPWLAYSAEDNGAYCLHCILFGHETGRNPGRIDKLYKSPLTNWVKAVSKFKEHQDASDFHKAAVIMGQEFLKVSKGVQKTVDQQLITGRERMIAENHKKLQSIVKTVVLCGKQNIALRGHRDDATSDPDCNPGNFQALLHFRVDAGDEILGEHLNTAGRNATYRSKTIQNEIIQLSGEWIQEKIVKEVTKNKFFSILADEATDISNQEQLPLIIRYVDGNDMIREDFVGFYACESGVTGEAISELIKSAVTSLGLDLADCRGQCYDGAGNMAGTVKGAAARILKDYPDAGYVHCNSHKLNLCVMTACQVQSVRNMLGTMGEIANYFNFSPKRQGLLEKQIMEICPKQTRQKLLNVCKTRWVQRLDALKVLSQLFEPVVVSLQIISTNEDKSWNADSTRTANTLFHAITTFAFIITFTVCRESLSFTKGLTVKLQSSSQDVMSAYEDINVVVECLKNVRQEVDTHHKKWHETAKALAVKLDVDITKPRTCGHQRNRANIPGRDSVEDYYRATTTVPFLDHLNNELHSRFLSGQGDLVSGFAAVPALIIKQGSKWKVNFQKFATKMEASLPSANDLPAEMSLWETMWRRRSQEKSMEIPANIQETILNVDKQMFPNMFASFVIMGVTPITTCECERSVSALRRLKTYLRNSMGQTRLTGLALMHVHYKMEVDIKEIVNKFARMHPRRMAMDVLE